MFDRNWFPSPSPLCAPALSLLQSGNSSETCSEQQTFDEAGNVDELDLGFDDLL